MIENEKTIFQIDPNLRITLEIKVYEGVSVSINSDEVEIKTDKVAIYRLRRNETFLLQTTVITSDELTEDQLKKQQKESFIIILKTFVKFYGAHIKNAETYLNNLP